MKIITGSGPSFFIRTDYLSLVNPENLVAGAEFDEPHESDILDAGLAFAAEKKAVDYLSRAEQSRSGLFKKLLAKDFPEACIVKALDYLEKISYLSDLRFARAWLNSRKINHSEGRSKLYGELLSRGISRENASAALDEFFENNDEMLICMKALQKYRRLKKSPEKMINCLMRAGFSKGMIKLAVKNEGELLESDAQV